jgi:hypothetical protein
MHHQRRSLLQMAPTVSIPTSETSTTPTPLIAPSPTAPHCSTNNRAHCSRWHPPFQYRQLQLQHHQQHFSLHCRQRPRLQQPKAPTAPTPMALVTAPTTNGTYGSIHRRRSRVQDAHGSNTDSSNTDSCSSNNDSFNADSAADRRETHSLGDITRE